MPPSTQEIVQFYLSSTALSMEQFGDQFGVGHATVIDWRDGNATPDTELMLEFRNYSDWRGAFAKEILAVKQVGRS